MPVGIGFGQRVPFRPGVSLSLRFTAPMGFHPGALWLAAAAPVLATLLLISRLAA
ncbi:hypothetical protein [Methylobacterium sp. NEAU K]|uniref:hypothetical protein n=1 Tax=Methylobacterium sp. NEAU K TaxID=3064946 RepID=UPI0027351338|nr:hypothetical protein [Methylobacterium sp. NEAU K]MDP4001932.1 hypothetical protein [Methylobacterium sp. NEAU K]